MEEWEIFKRVEKLEALEPTHRDASGIAVSAFLSSFVHSALASDNPRNLKDATVLLLELVQVSSETLKSLEKWMLAICEIIEKERK